MSRMDEHEKAILNQILNESDDDFDLNNLPTDLSFLNENDTDEIISSTFNNKLNTKPDIELINTTIISESKEDTLTLNQINEENPIQFINENVSENNLRSNDEIIENNEDNIKPYISKDYFAESLDVTEKIDNEEKQYDTRISNNETDGKEEITTQDEKKTEADKETNQNDANNEEENSDVPKDLSMSKSEESQPLKILSVKPLNTISKKMSSVEFKKKFGFPTCIDVSSKYIAIGTSKGALILFDHFQEIIFCIYDEKTDYGRLFSISLSSDSEWILAGHSSGIIMLWDIKSKKLIKSFQNESKSPIIYVCFLDDKKSKFIGCSLDGLVLTYSLSKVIGLFISDTHIVMTKTKEWGNVLALSPLLPDKHRTHPIEQYSLLACATYNRVIVLSLKEISHNLYALRRPKSIGNECIPYLAWRPLVSYYKDDGEFTLYDPVLAIAWGPYVNLIHISFKETKEEGLVPNFKIVASHKSNDNIIGIMWLDSGALIYVTNKNEMKLFDPFENDVIEVYKKRPIDLTHHNKLLDKDLNSLSSYHNSMCSYKGHVYTLGLNKVFTSNLLTWEERITYMTSKNRYIEAIGFLVDLIQKKTMVGVKLPRNPKRANLLLHQKMEEILNEYCITSLSNRADENLLNQVAIICLTCCFNIGRSDFIFSGLYPIFKKYGKEGLIFENIVPFIVGGKVYKLNADIIQQFFKFYESTDPRKIEDIIEYFDITLVDFHTIVKFSTKHLIAKPLLYIYIKALDDYITPLELLLSAFMDDSTQYDEVQQKEVLPKEIMNYIELIFNEKDFPSQDPLPHDKAITIRDKILDSFYYGDIKKIISLINYDCNRFLEVISIALDSMTATQQRLKDWLNMLLKIVYGQSDFSDDLSISQHQCALILIFVLRYLNLDNLDRDNIFDYEKIIKFLEPYPQYLYEFLKVYIEFRKDKSDFILDKETGERILHLMCQYEPDKVFNWIQEFSLTYEIEKALEITSKYESTLGTYCRLLERIGDISLAIDTIVSLALKKLSTFSMFVLEQNDLSVLEEEKSSSNSSLSIAENKKLMAMAISICKRNKEKIKESDFNKYLIKILDSYLVPIYIVDSLLTNNVFDHNKAQKDHEPFINASKLMDSEKLKFMKAYLHKIISFILENMLGFVDVTFILNQITIHGTTYWSDFKSIFHMVIENLLYEESILKTACQLLKDDAINSMQALLKKAKTRIRTSNIEIE